ncbi:hypothetical protein GCM10009092_44240 [Bowmanella denitrificans]|uniref:Lipoprotein n=1 Tax=Bowmanella denitrificans TaxID=366582 RepID=A0ABP3HNE7_9ALTE
MKKSFILIVLTAIAGLLIFFVPGLFGEKEAIDCNGDCYGVDIVNIGEETGETKPINSPAVLNNKVELTDKYISADKHNSSVSRKSLDEEWCVAEEELNQADLEYIRVLENDWHEVIGKAAIKGPSAINSDDRNYPNNAYVSSYQELPIEELKERAQSGDKWAMIAYVQSWYGKADLQQEIANKLLIMGASYHAIEYLIMQELVSAKSSYRKAGKVDENAKQHLINATAYTMLGLKDYSVSALTAFSGNISGDELFQSYLNPSIVLSDAEDDIRKRYLELDNSIEKAREQQSITIERPPEAVKRLFQQDIASYQYRNSELVVFLQGLNLESEVDLGRTPCTEKYLSRLETLNKNK